MLFLVSLCVYLTSNPDTSYMRNLCSVSLLRSPRNFCLCHQRQGHYPSFACPFPFHILSNGSNLTSLKITFWLAPENDRHVTRIIIASVIIMNNPLLSRSNLWNQKCMSLLVILHFSYSYKIWISADLHVEQLECRSLILLTHRYHGSTYVTLFVDTYLITFESNLRTLSSG